MGRFCNRGTLTNSHRMAARLGGHGLGALDQTRLSARALGAILNIHLSDVGPHAISLSHSGGLIRQGSETREEMPCKLLRARSFTPTTHLLLGRELINRDW